MHDVDARLVITVQKSIKRKDLNTIDVLVPNLDIQSAFEKLTKPLIHFQQKEESVFLANLRDTLLPKLLSGELSVSAAEEFVEGV